MKIKGLLDRKGLWRSLNEMKRIFNFQRTPGAGEELGPGILTSFLGHQLLWLPRVSENQAPICYVTLSRPLLDLTFPHRDKREYGRRGSLTF